MESQTLRVQRSCDWKFEVVDGENSFSVDLVDMTCSCRVWQINKIPCKQAISAIEAKSMSVYDFCDNYFKIEAYRAAYKGHINLIPTFDISESCVAESDIIQAPSVHSQPGRRKTKRIPSQVNKRVSTCGRCHARGHNRRSCKKPIKGKRLLEAGSSMKLPSKRHTRSSGSIAGLRLV
ncbi:uncharacterized protein [Henckelia pumila]|uniref:uncharacterized protein n=1 Tax=Henckelia pumila TaxID=405737 RepID=UPI003C6E3A07